MRSNNASQHISENNALVQFHINHKNIEQDDNLIMFDSGNSVQMKQSQSKDEPKANNAGVYNLVYKKDILSNDNRSMNSQRDQTKEVLEVVIDNDSNTNDKNSRNELKNDIKHLNPHTNIHRATTKKKSNVHLHHAHKHEGFDPFKIPCDWEKAKLHAQSRETKPELDSEEVISPDGQQGEKKMQEVCECCGYELKRKEIGLNVDTMELGFMGAGFPLYFNYIKYCCLMLFFLFCIQGIPNLVYNIQGEFCHTDPIEVFAAIEENHDHHQAYFLIPCPDTNLNKISMANVLDKMYRETNYDFHFSIAAVIVQLLLNILFRRSQRKIEQDVDIACSTPSDYTIMVQNVSQDITNIKETLKQIFEQYGTIEKINLVYDITELEHLENQIKKKVQEKQKIITKIQSFDLNNKEIQEIDHEIEKLEEQVHQMQIQMQADNKKFVGTAFISYSKEEEKQKAIKSNPQNDWKRFKDYFKGGKSEHNKQDQLYLEGRYLYISEAPEPNDVDWEFAHVKTGEKIKVRTIAFFKWLALTLASFVVIALISYLQSNTIDHILKQEHDIVVESEGREMTEEEQHHFDDLQSQKTSVTVLSFVISGIIVIWNKFFLPFIIHKICDHEKWATKTSLNVSFAYKLTIGLFFNTALITFFVEIIFFQNIYALAGGMIYNEFLIFIINAVVPALAWIIDPWKIWQDFKRNRQLKKKVCSLTQQEANSLMEHPSYTQGKRYADIMKTMWFTFFYSPIIPIGTVISLGGLIAYYITDKYNLIFRRTVKESISSRLSMQMIELVELSIIFHTFGEVFFKWFMSYYIDVGNFFLFIAVCVVVIIVPMDKINEFLFPLGDSDEEKTYKEVHLDFDTDYDRENPVTRKESLVHFQNLRNGIVTVVDAFKAAQNMVQFAHHRRASALHPDDKLVQELQSLQKDSSKNNNNQNTDNIQNNQTKSNTQHVISNGEIQI
ncbi:hypothetical protein ABPG74_016051 [Tetrahymena malaccensis]